MSEVAELKQLLQESVDVVKTLQDENEELQRANHTLETDKAHLEMQLRDLKQQLDDTQQLATDRAKQLTRLHVEQGLDDSLSVGSYNQKTKRWET